MAELDDAQAARRGSEGKCKDFISAIEKRILEFPLRDSFTDESWAEVLQSLGGFHDILGSALIYQLETADDKQMLRCIADSAGGEFSGQIEEEGSGVLWSLFAAEGEGQGPLFIPMVLADSRFPPGKYPGPGSLFAVPVSYEACLSAAAVEQLLVDPKSPVSGGQQVKLGVVFSTVGGSGEILSGAVRAALWKFCDAMAQGKRRCDENLLKRQVQFSSVTEKEQFGATFEIFDAADSAGKFKVAREIVSDAEWTSFVSEIFVASEAILKITAAFVFTLRAALQESVTSGPGNWNWIKLKAAAISAGKDATIFESTGPRLGIAAEHKLKNILSLLVPLPENSPLAARLMHAFVAGAAAERQEDVSKRRALLGPLTGSQKPEDLDADFE
jgi:hypothetical protein